MTTVEWRPCFQWLIRCRAISPDHKIVKSQSSQLEDFVLLLKDGVILCSLLNRLKMFAIDKASISFKPQTSQSIIRSKFGLLKTQKIELDYLCSSNIKLFLDTCRSQFGLKESDLFDTDDLFLTKNISKVIKTLSILSKSPAAQSSQISPFNHETSKVDSAVLPEKRVSKDSARGSEEYFNEEEEVYQYLVDIEQTSSPAADYGAVRGSSRNKCIDELLSTEIKYVDALKTLIDFFMIPLRECLTADDFSRIFFGIKELHEVNRGFCDQLIEASTSSGSIAECFLNWKDRFSVYGEYCAHLKSAQELLDSLCQQNPAIDVKLKECQHKAYEGQFKLRDMLAIPMQRILKYNLLLKELIKSTSDTHFDRDKLDSAFDEMRNLSLFTNEMVRDFETIHQIKLIERSIIGLKMPENASLCNYGRLLLDGELQIKFNNKAAKARYIFLFDKLMVLCKRKSRRETYRYKEFILLFEYAVDAPVFQDRSLGYAFTMTKDGTNDSKYTFGSREQETVIKWMDAINLAKDNVKPRHAMTSKHEFVITWFDKPEKCAICHKLLRGVFFQGYRCKKTLTVAHKECLGKASDITGAAVVLDNIAERQRAFRKSRIFTEKMNLDAVAEHPSSVEERPSPRKEFSDSPNCLNRNRSVGSNSRPVPRIPVEYPAGVSTDRRRTVPDLPLGGCTLPQQKPLYVNESVRRNQDLTGFPWYVGEMSRDIADSILKYLPEGSFIVRQSVSAGRVDKFALSLKLNETKHLRVEDNGQKFYLVVAVQFDSLEALVAHYEKNSLVSHFHEIPTTLRIPYRQAVQQLRDSQNFLGFCIALYDYDPSEPNQLTLRVDDVVVLIDKQHDRHGWWKGTLNERTGYFPKAYVHIEDDIEDD